MLSLGGNGGDAGRDARSDSVAAVNGQRAVQGGGQSASLDLLARAGRAEPAGVAQAARETSPAAGPSLAQRVADAPAAAAASQVDVPQAGVPALRERKSEQDAGSAVLDNKRSVRPSGPARQNIFAHSVEHALHAQLDGLSFDRAAVRESLLALSGDRGRQLPLAKIDPEATRGLTLKTLQTAEARGASAVLGIPFQPLKDAWLAVYGEFSKRPRSQSVGDVAGAPGASVAALAAITNDQAASLATTFLGHMLRHYFSDASADGKAAAADSQPMLEKGNSRRPSVVQVSQEELLAAALERMRRASVGDQRAQMLAELAAICKGAKPDFIDAIFGRLYKHAYFQAEIGKAKTGDLPFIGNLMTWLDLESGCAQSALSLVCSLMESPNIAGHVVPCLVEPERFARLLDLASSDKPEASAACHVLAAMARNNYDAEGRVIAALVGHGEKFSDASGLDSKNFDNKTFAGRNYDAKDSDNKGERRQAQQPVERLCAAWRAAFQPVPDKASADVFLQKNVVRFSRADLLAVYMLGSEKRIEQVVGNLGSAPVPHLVSVMRQGPSEQRLIGLRFLASAASCGGERMRQIAQRLVDDDWKWLVLNARSNNPDDALTQPSIRLLTALCEDPAPGHKVAALYHSTFKDLPTPRSELILEQIGIEPLRPGLELMIDVAGLQLKVGDDMQEPKWRAEKAQLLEKLVRNGVIPDGDVEKILDARWVENIIELAVGDSGKQQSLFSILGSTLQRTDQSDVIMRMLTQDMTRGLVDMACRTNTVEALPVLRLLELVTNPHVTRKRKDVWGWVAYALNKDEYRRRLEMLAAEGLPQAERLLERFPPFLRGRSESRAPSFAGQSFARQSFAGQPIQPIRSGPPSQLPQPDPIPAPVAAPPRSVLQPPPDGDSLTMLA